jgi:anti-anti-sigma factor
MIPQRFQLRIDENAGNVLVHVVGPLDVEHARPFQEKVGTLLRTSGTVILSFLRTDYIDSEGVRSLLALQRSAEAAHTDLRLVLRPGSRAERTLLLLRLQGHFHIHASVRSALDAAGPAPPPMRALVAG